MEQHGFNWFATIPALAHVPYHIVAASFVALLLVGLTLLARVTLGVVGIDKAIVPSSKFGFLNFFDIISEKLYAMTEQMLGKDAPQYFPLIGSLFLFILTSNLLGVIPGFSPPTDNVNTTLACGIFVFLYYNYQGFKASGFSYLKHFLGPVWYMAFLMLPIEIVSHLARPLSLALRLKGNMTGDHMVLSVFTDLVPYGLPIVFYFLGLLVC